MLKKKFIVKNSKENEKWLKLVRNLNILKLFNLSMDMEKLVKWIWRNMYR